MSFKTRILIMLTCFSASASVLAHDQIDTASDTHWENQPQLVKKLRADNTRLPVEQLIEKHTKQAFDADMLSLVSPLSSGSAIFNQPNQQAGR